MLRWCAVALILIASEGIPQEAPKLTTGSLAIEDVLKMVGDGVSEEIIIVRIKQNNKAFDLNADEIGALKKRNVSERLILYLLDPNYKPPVEPPPPKPVPLPLPPPKPPSDPLALKVPVEPGIYYLTAKQEFFGLDLKPVVPAKQPGKSLIPVVKGHIIGSVIGPAAKTRLAPGTAIFYVRLAEKAGIDDLALLSLKREHSRRDLDFGTKAGKPVFPVKALRQFESKGVDTGLFRVTVLLKQSGEYLFFILGSGDEKKGLLGKGYDFGVD